MEGCHCILKRRAGVTRYFYPRTLFSMRVEVCTPFFVRATPWHAMHAEKRRATPFFSEKGVARLSTRINSFGSIDDTGLPIPAVPQKDDDDHHDDDTQGRRRQTTDDSATTLFGV